MAGKPKLRAAVARIDQVGIDAILHQVAAGTSLRVIAGGLDISRPMLSTYLNQNHREALRQAREHAADALAEQTLDIADQATPDTVAVAKLRVDSRRWIAAKWDREGYGEAAPKFAVNIDLRALHLDALRKRNAMEEGNARVSRAE